MAESDAIGKVRAGDVEAFGELIDAHVRRLRAHIALRAPVPQLIDEIAHETFVHAYRNLDQFEGGSFGAWLSAIADNLLRAEVQRFSREQAQRASFIERALFEVSAQTAGGVAPAQELDRLRSCLEKLPPASRRLVRLRYELNCSAAEAAAQLGRGVAWVRTTLFRVRRQLKDCIETQVSLEKAQ